jgi:hypothetical protein
MQKTPAPASPDAYVDALVGWQADQVRGLRAAVREAVPSLWESIKWGHLVYHSNGPVLLIRAEEQRVLFGFWRGQRLRGIEPRLKPGGQYEMATLTLQPDTPLARATVRELTRQAVAFNDALGDPARVSG